MTPCVFALQAVKMYHVAELKPFVIFLRPPPISEISQLTVSGPCVGRSTHTGQKTLCCRSECDVGVTVCSESDSVVWK